MPGNILLGASILIYISLANLVLKGHPGGDAGVGYSWVYFISSIALITMTGLLTWYMAYNQLFNEFFASFAKYKNGIVFFTWAAFLASLLWSLEYHSKWHEGEFLFYMKWFAKSKMYLWLPIIVFGLCFYLINFQAKTIATPSWINYGAKLGFSVIVIVGFGIFFAWSKFFIQNKLERISSKIAWMKQSKKEDDEEYQKALTYVATYQDSTINGLLKYVTAYDETLQNNAVTKIKSFPNHETDMIDILMNPDLENAYIYHDNTQYVYTFLENNKVKHPEKFVQPIITSIEASSRRTIRDIEDPYSWEMGLLNLESVCKVLDGQFKSYAIEFKPCILNLQKILSVDVPDRTNDRIRSQYKRQLKRYRSAVDKWLEMN